MMRWSNFRNGEAAAIAEAEIFWAAASRLNSASHWSKFAVLRQFAWPKAAVGTPAAIKASRGRAQARNELRNELRNQPNPAQACPSHIAVR